MSAKIYGPLLTISSLGLTISDKITASRPKQLRSNFAHSVPNCPRPPLKLIHIIHLYYIKTIKSFTLSFSLYIRILNK